MTITLQAVNELIASLESAGELSIREQKFLKLAKEFRICSASLDAAIKTGNMLADQNAQLAAENVALKGGPQGFFAYGSECGYEEFDTAEEATEFAEAEIADFRDQACDGWSDEVGSVVWGIVMQRASMNGLRPVTEDDNVPSHIEEWCDYTLLPAVETHATDRIVAEAEARGVEKAIAHLDRKFSNIGVQIMNLQWLADSLREGAGK